MWSYRFSVILSPARSSLHLSVLFSLWDRIELQQILIFRSLLVFIYWYLDDMICSENRNGDGLREEMLNSIFDKAATLSHCWADTKAISLDLYCDLNFIRVLFKKWFCCGWWLLLLPLFNFGRKPFWDEYMGVAIFVAANYFGMRTWKQNFIE